MIHPSYKGTMRISNTKRHCHPFIQSKFIFKSSFSFIFIFYSTMVLSTFWSQ